MTKNKNKNKGSKLVSEKTNYRYQALAGNGKSGITKQCVSRGEHATVCALTDPFCPEAKGIRLPDSDTAPAVPYQSRTFGQFNTVGDGSQAISFKANLGASFRTATGLDASSNLEVTTWGTWGAVSDHATIVNFAKQVRIVNWGVRIWSMAAPTDQGGSIRVITSAEEAVNGQTFSGGLFEEVETYPVYDTMVHWVSKPMGNEYKEYASPGHTADYNQLTVFIVGAAASSAFGYEIVYNIEAVVAIDNTLAAVAVPGAENPRLIHAADHTNKKRKHAHRQYPSLMDTVKGLAREGLVSAANYFLPMVGGAVANAIMPRRSQPAQIQWVD